MIQAIVLDVDGTLTDGKIYLSAEGELMKAFNIKDGLALARLPKVGVTAVVLTGRTSEITRRRCEELKISVVHQGVENKRERLDQIASDLACGLQDLAFIGDDINDLECLQAVGYSACPADAATQVIPAVQYVSTLKGGDGAVREILEHWISIGQLPAELLG